MSSVLIFGVPVEGEVLSAVIDETTPTVTVPPGRRRKWRFIFTDLHSVTTTWAQGIQYGRKYTETLGDSSMMEGSVDPDDFRVNGIWTDGYPRVAQSNRMVYGFRREGNPDGGAPWIVRAAGVLMAPTDDGDETSALSHWIAYDPRKLMDALPFVKPNGVLVGPDGYRDASHGAFNRGSDLIAGALRDAITYLGSGDGAVFHIDAGPEYGGTAFYGSTGASIDLTDPLNLFVQQGSMIGDVWRMAEETGTVEIRLNPIYDPVNRPGYTHELAIHKQVGSDKWDCVFGWDKLNRAINKIERVHDATPGSFINVVDYFAGQGGPVAAIAGGPIENGASVADFGPYWSAQWFPASQSSLTDAAAILLAAQQALVLAKQGKRTLALDITPERAKTPLLDYRVGDRIIVHATKRLRVTSDGRQRVQTIPIEITDDGIETLNQLLTSPDFLNLLADAPGMSTLKTTIAPRNSTLVAANSMIVSRTAPKSNQIPRTLSVIRMPNKTIAPRLLRTAPITASRTIRSTSAPMTTTVIASSLNRLR